MKGSNVIRTQGGQGGIHVIRTKMTENLTSSTAFPYALPGKTISWAKLKGALRKDLEKQYNRWWSLCGFAWSSYLGRKITDHQPPGYCDRHTARGGF